MSRSRFSAATSRVSPASSRARCASFVADGDGALAYRGAGHRVGGASGRSRLDAEAGGAAVAEAEAHRGAAAVGAGALGDIREAECTGIEAEIAVERSDQAAIELAVAFDGKPQGAHRRWMAVCWLISD